MTTEITIQVQIGNVMFSFRTDESGADIEHSIKAIQKILKTHGQVLATISSKELATKKMILAVSPPVVSLADLSMSPQLKEKITLRVRRVPYWDLVLAILYHSPRSLSYDDLISISKEIGKPIAYDWLNTEFQRTKYRGLVRSEEIPGSKKRNYSITETGRKKAESLFRRLEDKTSQQ